MGEDPSPFEKATGKSQTQEHLSTESSLVQASTQSEFREQVDFHHIDPRIYAATVVGGSGNTPQNSGYANISFSKLKRVVNKELNTQAPEYRKLTRGASFEGICHNKYCPANSCKVWVNNGFGKFNMNRVCCKSKCPLCKKVVDQVNNVSLFMGTMKMDGMYDDGKQTHKKRQTFTHDQVATYFTFDGIDNEVVQWRYLQFKVWELGNNPTDTTSSESDD